MDQIFRYVRQSQLNISLISVSAEDNSMNGKGKVKIEYAKIDENKICWKKRNNQNC